MLSQGERPELSYQPCRIVLPAVSGIQPELADATVQRSPPVVVAGQWQQVEDDQGRVTFKLSTPNWSSVVVGATKTPTCADVVP